MSKILAQGTAMTTEKRIEALERRCRRQAAMMAVMIGLAVIGAVGMHPQRAVAQEAGGKTAGVADELRARKFVLVDAKGKPRALLFTNDGGTALTLSDAKGKPRALLVTNDGGTALTLSDAKGKPCALLATDDDGTGLSLWDAKGMPRALLFTKDDGTALELSDARGKPRALLATNDGGSGLELSDARGKPIWTAPR